MTRDGVDTYPFRGFSMHLNVGRFGGWGVHRDGPSIRIGLGRMGIVISLRDLDACVGELIKSLEDADKARP